MEGDKKIKMPEPLHVKRIHAKLDLFSKNNIIRQWPGYDLFDTLFYLYLFNKYKNNCLIKYKGVTSNMSLGLELQIVPRFSQRDSAIYQEHLVNISKQLANCIGRNLNSVIIPLYLKTPKGGHANVLIYRKKDNVIEHFEPHGSKFSGSNDKTNKLIELRLDEFIAMVNSHLKKHNRPPVKLIPSNDVCPYIDGLQTIETYSTDYKLLSEGGGYCAAWSMFFTELALKNPSVSSNELLAIIYDKLDKNKEKQANYLRQVIRGYVNLIYDKCEKYFYFMTGTKGNINKIIENLQKGNYSNIILDFHNVVRIQASLLNDPSLTKKRYLDILEYRKMKITDPYQIMEIDKEIKMLKNMELLLSPSLTPDSVSSTQTKSSKPKGRQISPKTRTRKNKPIRVCPEGSKMNLETGRCNKIKVYPPCPPTRDPITHRCKAIVE